MEDHAGTSSHTSQYQTLLDIEMIEPVEDGILLTVHVQPKAAKTEFLGVHGDALKFRVAAPPVAGEANAALCAYLAGLFVISKSSVSASAGHTKRKKRIKVIGITRVQVCEKLHIVTVNDCQ